MKVQAIIPAAGMGTRLKSETIKSMILIHGKPLLIYTLEIFEMSPSVQSVVLVVPKDRSAEFEEMVKRYSLTKVSRIVSGGATRRESVYNGLKALDQDTETVVVHDAARPLVTVDLIERAIESCEQTRAAVVAVPVKPTIKRVDPETMCVRQTLARRGLWEIQTPQVFKKETLVRAHQQPWEEEATDDAMLVENLGEAVKIVEGNYRNIKVTTPEDLVMAEAFLKPLSAFILKQCNLKLE